MERLLRGAEAANELAILVSVKQSRGNVGTILMVSRDGSEEGR